MKEKIESLERKILLCSNCRKKDETISLLTTMYRELKEKLSEYEGTNKQTGQPLPNFHLKLVKRANES